MAEVLTHWPELRKKRPAAFTYPWAQWIDLDENGHGDIWLAEQGIDFPETSSAVRFRAALYDRAQVLTRQRKKKAPLVVKRVRVKSTGEEKVRRVPDFTTLKVKVKMISDSQVAFQFYEGDEPPPEPPVQRVAIPRRKPVHRAVTRRTIEKKLVSV
jgi:hypothetical protein